MPIIQGKMPYGVWIDENEGTIHNATNYQPYFTREILIAIRDGASKTLAAYDEEGLSDLAIDQMNKDYVERANQVQEVQQVADRAKPAEKKGYVYLMRDTANGFVKIGFSRNPQYRETTLQSEKPTIELFAQWDASVKHEVFLHQMLGAKRLRGEWFSLLQEDIDRIENYFLSDGAVWETTASEKAADHWAGKHSDAYHSTRRDDCDHCQAMIGQFGPMPSSADIVAADARRNNGQVTYR